MAKAIAKAMKTLPQAVWPPPITNHLITSTGLALRLSSRVKAQDKGQLGPLSSLQKRIRVK